MNNQEDMINIIKQTIILLTTLKYNEENILPTITMFNEIISIIDGTKPILINNKEIRDLIRLDKLIEFVKWVIYEPQTITNLYLLNPTYVIKTFLTTVK